MFRKLKFSDLLHNYYQKYVDLQNKTQLVNCFFLITIQ